MPIFIRWRKTNTKKKNTEALRDAGTDAGPEAIADVSSPDSWAELQDKNIFVHKNTNIAVKELRVEDIWEMLCNIQLTIFNITVSYLIP
jgi:hypothetical protein